jgi:hypothetical protein
MNLKINFCSSLQENLIVSKKPAVKKLFGTKYIRSSNTREVSIQKSSSGSEMAIEFVSDGSDDDINDGRAVLIFTGLFLIDKDGEKWAQYVRCCR